MVFMKSDSLFIVWRQQASPDYQANLKVIERTCCRALRRKKRFLLWIMRLAPPNLPTIVPDARKYYYKYLAKV
jgi:hypothetical protein